jgi:hypothetical protein
MDLESPAPLRRSPHNRTLLEQRDVYRDHIEIFADAAHLDSVGRLVERTVLIDCSVIATQLSKQYLPTCSAFSTLRRILDALSGRGKSSSSPARGCEPV